METQQNHLSELISILDQMVGLHRNLLENCRDEKVALSEANLKLLQEKTLSKEYIVESIKNIEKKRSDLFNEINFNLNSNRPLGTLTELINEVEGSHPEESNRLRSLLTTLMHLVGSIQKINDQNKEFISKNIVHIEEMKKNVLGESNQKSDTYGNKGSVNGIKNSPRLFSKEV